jgi:hypothetical protein
MFLRNAGQRHAGSTITNHLLPVDIQWSPADLATFQPLRSGGF